MKRIIESQEFDIDVAESPNGDGIPNYVVRYGLGSERKLTLEGAMIEFLECLDHAMACKGLLIDY